MINLSTVAFRARNALHPSGANFSHAHVLELVASLLGYGTYAALKLDPRVDVSEMFVEADHVVFQSTALPKRMRKLGLDQNHAIAVGEAVIDACRQAVEEGRSPCRFHASMEDFQDFVFDDVQIRAFDDSDVSSAYAETNAYIDEFYTENYEYEPLIDTEEEWTLAASGSHTGEVDTERPYSGHAGSFTATYSFRKVGRCGLIEIDLDFALGFDLDYDED